MSHIVYNKETNRYENDRVHITLLNSTFIKKPSFDATSILSKYHKIMPSVTPTTLELSTRGKYSKETGFYLSAYTINLNPSIKYTHIVNKNEERKQ